MPKNQCVLPVMTYEAKTWHMTVKLAHRLHVTQRAMERCMLGISDILYSQVVTYFKVDIGAMSELYSILNYESLVQSITL